MCNESDVAQKYTLYFFWQRFKSKHGCIIVNCKQSSCKGWLWDLVVAIHE